MQPTRRQFVTASAAVAAACAGCPLLAGAAETASAGAAPVDVGPLDDFAADGVFDRWAAAGFFVVRRGGRLFAVSSTCTHKKVRLVSSAKGGASAFKCPRHGSGFDANGHATKAPARKPLPRHGVRLDDRGHVLVDRAVRFSKNDWDDPAAFVATPKDAIGTPRKIHD